MEAAEIALRILHQLVRLQAAVDAEGNPLQPLPIVHRTLASPQCLPHIAQAFSPLFNLWLCQRLSMTQGCLEHCAPYTVKRMLRAMCLAWFFPLPQ